MQSCGRYILTGLVKDGLLSMKEAAIRADMTEGAFETEMEKLFKE